MWTHFSRNEFAVELVLSVNGPNRLTNNMFICREF